MCLLSFLSLLWNFLVVGHFVSVLSLSPLFFSPSQLILSVLKFCPCQKSLSNTRLALSNQNWSSFCSLAVLFTLTKWLDCSLPAFWTFFPKSSVCKILNFVPVVVKCTRQIFVIVFSFRRISTLSVCILFQYQIMKAIMLYGKINPRITLQFQAHTYLLFIGS